MKTLIFLLFVSIFDHLALIAQNNFFFGTPVAMGYQKLGAAKGTAGIIGDNYYVLENDYGGAFDFNNNIRTIVTSFSISEGKFKNRFNLNEMVANSRKEMNKILFCDVIAWKDKLVGFYTYKNASGKNFLASGIVCDANGKLIKSDIDIGDFQHDYLNGSFLWQGGLLVNGRNTLSVVKDFQYRMIPDSSSIVVLCSPSESSGNVRFKTYDNNLVMQKEITAAIPLKSKVADMIDFGMDNNGYVYIITKSDKSKAERNKVSDDDDYFYELHIINTKDNNKVNTLPLDFADRGITNVELIIKNDNQVYCFGNCWNIDNKKSTRRITGVFSAYVNNNNPAGQLVKSTYDLPDSIFERLSYDKKEKKENKNGLEAKFTPYQAFPDNEGGMYVIMVNEVIDVFVRGNTGAMNSYSEVTKSFMISYINPDKKVKWSVDWGELARNAQGLTRSDRSCFFVSGTKLFGVFIAGQKQFYRRIFNKETGTFMPQVAIGSFLDPYGSFRQLEKSVMPLGNNQFAIMTFANQLSLGRFKIE
jgi:hypothetical protein